MPDDMDIPMPAMAPAYRVPARPRQEMDPATRRLAIFAGVIGSALLLLVGVWSFTGHRHAGGVPVIEADSRPLRVKPADPGGLRVADADASIMSGESDDKTAMAPPPEAPKPEALKEEEQAAKPAPPPATAAPASASAPASVAAAPPPPAEPTPPEPAKPAATARPASAPAKPVVTASAAKPATPPPPAMRSQPGMTAAVKPTSLAASTGTPLVQLAAMDSEAQAKSEWERLVRKYGELLAGRRPVITKIERAGKTYWRLRTGGFADATQAVVFCERVKTKGGGCSVASL